MRTDLANIIPQKVLDLLEEGQDFGLKTTLEAFGITPYAVVVNPSVALEIKHMIAVGDSEKPELEGMELVEDRDIDPDMMGFRYGDPAEQNIILCRLK